MIRKAALLTLLTAVLAPSGMAGTAAAAPAGVTAAPVADPLVVEQITPQVIQDPATPITISGMVTGTPLASVRVVIRYSAHQPFRSRSEMQSFVAEQGYSTPSYSTKIQATPLDGAGKLPFSFTVTPRDLRMSRPGVYPFSVEVLDATTGQRIAIERTFLPYVPKDEQIPKVGLALALPIVDRPHRADDDTFLDDDLRASVSTGRLANLLKLVGETGKTVTWFVDPALLDDARRSATARYTVKTRTGSEAKTADPTARQWLTDLRTALAGKPVVATPYADPDVAALVHNGLDSSADNAIKKGAPVVSDVLGREVRATTAWPVGGVIDRDALDEVATAGVRTLLISGNALPPQLPSDVTPPAAATLDSVSGQLTALLIDPVVSQTLDVDASVPGSALLARQRFLAETAMIAFEQPGRNGRAGQAGQAGRAGQTSKTVIAAPANRLWSPDPAYIAGLLKTASTVPWLRLTSLGSVKPGKTQVPRSDLVYTERERRAELSRSYLEAVKELDQEAAVTATSTADHTQLFDDALLRLTSAAWRGDGKKAASFLKQVDAAVDARTGKVSVISDPRAIAGANGQRVDVPVSVDNILDQDVQIKIKVTSDDTSRLAIDAPGGIYETDTLTVSADRSQLVNVPVIVLGEGGETTISVQLLTAQGKPYGDRVRVTVRATGYTGIALVIVGAALTIMLAAVIMRVLRRRSRKAFPFSGAEPPVEEPSPVPAEHGETPHA